MIHSLSSCLGGRRPNIAGDALTFYTPALMNTAVYLLLFIAVFPALGLLSVFGPRFAPLT
jgi:hypothetical protein